MTSEIENGYFQQVVSKVEALLQENTEWIDRYDKYADLLLERQRSLQQLARQFNRYAPLQFYISVSQAKASASTLRLDIRYMGQTVAELMSKPKGVFISTEGKLAETNMRDFGYGEVLEKNENWKNAVGFRKFFSASPPRSTEFKGNEEHNVESLLISEFEKESSDDKKLLGIQPMKFASKKLRFSMPTPLSASNHRCITYSGSSGGGIDILARTGRGHTRLCVIEVKDENIPVEPPKDALEQAIAYAVFLQRLLRSKAGGKWWKIFGFAKELPDSIVINASIAMPYNEKQYDTDFAFEKLRIGTDCIECHYIYFTGEMNAQGQYTRILDFTTSFKQWMVS